MIRTLAILLTAAVLLTFCSCGDTAPSANTDTTTTPTTEMTTTQPESSTTTTQAPDEATLIKQKTEEVEKRICAFFDGFKNGDAEALNRQLQAPEVAAYLADAVKLADYSLTPHEGNGYMEYYQYYVDLIVLESTFDRIPAGESKWVLWLDEEGNEVTDFYFSPINEDLYAYRFPGNVSAWTPEYFCYKISTTFDWFDSISSSSLSNQDLLNMDEEVIILYHTALAKTNRYEKAEVIDTPNRVADFAATTFGVNNVDFTKSEWYISDRDILFLDGRGGLWSYALPLSVVRKGNRITVDIRYYADQMYLMEAATLRYEIEQCGYDYRFLSCKKISSTPFESLLRRM